MRKSHLLISILMDVLFLQNIITGICMAGPPPFAQVKSPEFNADGTITFRIWAPKADEVQLQCSNLLGDQSDQMERFDKEYWRITVKPASSGQFRYKFIVDGVQTPDPVNSLNIGTSRSVSVY